MENSFKYDSNQNLNSDIIAYLRMIIVLSMKIADICWSSLNRQACVIQQNSYSISHLLETVTAWWQDSDSVVTVDNCQQHSNLSCAANGSVFTVLLAVNNCDYSVTVLSPCTHCLLGNWWNRSFAVYIVNWNRKVGVKLWSVWQELLHLLVCQIVITLHVGPEKPKACLFSDDQFVTLPQRNLTGESGLLFTPVKAMKQPSYCRSRRTEASYCTFGFGAINRHDLRA